MRLDKNATVQQPVQKMYDRLWANAIEKIRAGSVEADPVLAAGLPDKRRGLTLIARPSASVRQRVEAFLRELRELEPEQHYYAPTELHVTVLSLFTATPQCEPFMARIAAYRAAVDGALRSVGPIKLSFSGVTASAGTVMIQGFFENETLNDLRNALRCRLRSLRIEDGVDTRYRLETAHMTAVRFRARLRASERFAQMLEGARNRCFGKTSVKSVSLVKNDWYMTDSVVEAVQKYRLSTK